MRTQEEIERLRGRLLLEADRSEDRGTEIVVDILNWTLGIEDEASVWNVAEFASMDIA